MPAADLLVTGISQLATPGGTGVRRGRQMSQIDIVENAAIAITGGRITWVGRQSAWEGKATADLDLGGRAVIPGLVDPHTHAIWAGDRFADFEARATGVSYEEILQRGGGIRSTIQHTADAPIETLVALARPRIDALIASGATTIEIKSGYGFSREGELASLAAIAALRAQTPAAIVATLLIHVPPRDHLARADYVQMVTDDLIPAAGPHARAVDVFIEREAFNVKEARRIFAAARRAGLGVKAHVDQFNVIGGLEAAVEAQALSVDHLEASGPEQIACLTTSGTIGVVLPGVTLHLGLPAVNAGAIIEGGGAVAVGTDLNPGSSPLFSTQLAMALSIRINGLTPAEALTAATANAAAALAVTDAGRIAPGQRADFCVLADRDWRVAPWTMGTSPVERVFIAGCEAAR
jgi:imidazolonepropionase